VGPLGAGQLGDVAVPQHLGVAGSDPELVVAHLAGAVLGVGRQLDRPGGR
jgi:hypothetical protein